MKRSIVLAALIIGVFSLTRPSPAVAVQRFQFVSIKMFTRSHGWATLGILDTRLDGYETHLVHTVDGGKTWVDATPPRPSPIPIRARDFLHIAIPFPFFLDDTHVFFYIPETCSTLGEINGRGSVWLTRDAGQNWSQSPVDCHNMASEVLTFIDASHGWLFGTDCCAAGNEPALLYQTVDGGTSWQLINAVAGFPYGTTGFDTETGNLPDTYHTGLIFKSPTDGWMTTSSIIRKGSLLHTTNGGKDWDYIDLPNPPGYADPSTFRGDLYGCDLNNLAVFQPASLTFVAVCWQQSYTTPTLYLYHTDDSGKTWQIAAPDVPLWNTSGMAAAQIQMLTPVIGWAYKVDRDTSTAYMYQTIDGGTHWIPVSAPDKQGDVGLVFQFVDPRTGWAISQATSQLKYTSDGGKNWTPLSVQIPILN